MAITVSPLLSSKLQLLGSRSPWADNLPLAEPMTSIMSYQYRPLPPPSGEMDMSHPAYAPTYNTPPPQHSPMGSFSTSSAGMSQSSNPDAQQASQLGLSAEKKRNKLGYHRTSVACGHCRRRKIRCVPAPADLQGRCANCIRLKKDCSFHPVDQPPPTDTNLPRQTSKTPIGPKGSSLSPTASTGNLPEPGNTPFSPMSQHMPNGPTPTLKSDTSEVYPPDTKGPLTSADRSFDFGGQSATSWIPNDARQSPGSKPGDLNNTWRGYPPESPISAQFSPYGPAPPSATWTSGSSEPGSREDMPWSSYPPPVRSMSYGGEPLPGHQSSQYPPVPQGRQFDRRASTLSDVYTPAMGVPVSGMETSSAPGMDSTGPLSSGPAPPPPFGAWSQPPHASQPPTYSYPTWAYGENGAGHPVHVEHGQQLADTEPPPSVFFTR